jgi:hypothetical protein
LRTWASSRSKTLPAQSGSIACGERADTSSTTPCELRVEPCGQVRGFGLSSFRG